MRPGRPTHRKSQRHRTAMRVPNQNRAVQLRFFGEAHHQMRKPCKAGVGMRRPLRLPATGHVQGNNMTTGKLLRKAIEGFRSRYEAMHNEHGWHIGLRISPLQK